MNKKNKIGLALVGLASIFIASFFNNTFSNSHDFNSPKTVESPVEFSIQHPKNFQEAKRLAKRVYQDHRFTFYCDCKYDKHGKIDLKSCGYKIQKDKRRANRIEWEHIMPVSLWGQNRACWKEKNCFDEQRGVYGGRQCCKQKDEIFAKMEADLHNLVPEVGELNALRSNYRFGMLPHMQASQFGACYFKVDDTLRRVEPKPSVRGMIARAYLYMSKTYHIHLSDSQQQLFSAWNRECPPNDWEKVRDQRIAKLQGNHNFYVLNYELELKQENK